VQRVTTADEPDQHLAAAVEARRTARALDDKILIAEQRCAALDSATDEARSKLGGETTDVERLEHLSWTRILSALRGDRVSDLEREQAERDEAAYRLREAEARARAARIDLDGLRAQRQGLGDVDAAYAIALENKELWTRHHDTSTASELDRIADERGRLAAEQREVEEAIAAGRAALGELNEAARLLESARSWSAWDTWGGGGFLTSVLKHERLDEVATHLEKSDHALRTFTLELADVHLEGIERVSLDGLTSAFDVWFDNIFTDLAVRRRIIDAQERVAQAIDGVRRIHKQLSERSSAVRAEVAGLATARERLLTT
jgi:hypothetical protein